MSAPGGVDVAGTLKIDSARVNPPRILFVLTVLLAATLLFLVQPMAARMLLPSYGGSPSVWTTCMLFFQVILLAGYCGAHALARYVSLRWQVIIQALFAIAALGVLPLQPASLTAPADLHAPMRSLLLSLLVSVGPPLLVLSATAPLLQRWFSMTSASNPYVLYAASNLGSLAALLGYPFIVERWLPMAAGGRLMSQATLWSLGYGLFVLAALATGTLASLGSRRSPAASAPRPAAAHASIAWRTRLTWLVLAFIPSSAMLGVTLYLTTDVAAVPLLWVIPLSIYLLTYVIAFSGKRAIPVRLARFALAVFLAGVATLPFLWYRPHPVVATVVHLGAFFFLALVLHGDLSRSRPAPERLTEFYLWIATGGALGGVLNALVAPVLFDTVVEYPIVLVGGCLLATRSRILALLLTAAFVAATIFVGPPGSRIHGERTFFGVVRVMRDEGLSFVFLEGARKGQEQRIPGNILLHGTTRHGIQLLDPALRYKGTSYYHLSGPLGDVFRSYVPAGRVRDVAVIGLGTGTIAAYGQTGQRFDFYEIDPAVARIAQDPEYFTYITDSRAKVNVHLSDGRLGLAAAPRGEVDLLIVDAFTSDAIPVHLLTREAFQLYIASLRPGGLVAIHVTNKYFDLIPVARAIANSLKIEGMVRRDYTIDDKQRVEGKNTSDWVVLAPDAETLVLLRQRVAWTSLGDSPADGRYLWTDDYASPLSVMRW